MRKKFGYLLIESGIIEHCFLLLENEDIIGREFFLCLLMNLSHFNEGK